VVSGQLGLAAELSSALMATLDSLLGISYPLSKLDIVAFPNLEPTASEPWGVITLSEASLMFQEDSSTARQEIMETLAWKISQQWLGGLVTMEDWSE
jgi:tricorn protease interacting factor F2/3